MPLLVPNVVRCTIHGTYFGAPVANIMDFFVAEGFNGGTREEACETVAGNVLYTWATEMLPALNANYVMQSVSWVDLSEVNGSVGSVTSRGAVTLPLSGQIVGEGYAQNVATLVTKHTVARRGERPGRMFLVPPGESFVEGSFITTAHVTTLNTALEDFLTEVTVDVGTPDIAYPVVVHAQNLVAGTSSRITALTVRRRVSSQRRRNR